MNDFATEAIKRYRRELHRFLMRRLRRPQDVEDLAQEVYLRLLRLDENKVVLKPLAYLYGISSHVLADYHLEIEQEREHVTVDSDAVEEWEDDVAHDHKLNYPDVLADRINLQQQLEEFLSQLPPTHAAVLVAHKRDGMSYDEVAEKFGLSIHTVEKYVTQAKARIRAMPWER